MAPQPSSSDAAFLQRWEIQRAPGRWRYIGLSGVLAWGVPMFVVMTFVVMTFVVSPPSEFTFQTLAVAGAFWLSGGFAFGSLMWVFSERRYRRLSSASSNVPKKEE